MHYQNVQPLIAPVKNGFYFLFMLLSIAVLIISLFFSLRGIRTRDAGKSFRLFTLGILLSAVIMFFPIYSLDYRFGDNFTFFRSILLSLHNSMRLFILDGDFDFIVDHISSLSDVLKVFFSLHAAILYVIAPMIFTFTIILTVFRETIEQFQFLFFRNSPTYIFSCLNEESAAMARNILQTGNQQTSLIVFCSLSREETEQERLNSMVPNLPGIHIPVLSTSKGIADFNTAGIKAEITFFLMDRDEAKNIRDAASLSQSLYQQSENNQNNDPLRQPVRRILVYASSAASGPLLDSLSQKISVPNATVERLADIINCAADEKARTSLHNSNEKDRYDITGEIQDALKKEDHLRFFVPFSLTRVDSIKGKKQMAARIIQEINEAEKYKAFPGNSDQITITLLGLGGIGADLLSGILCNYQKYGCKLIVNVFDATGPELGDDPDNAGNPLYDSLTYEWPELIETNRKWQLHPEKHPDTESEYDIRFYLGIDCFSSKFRDYFERSEDRERLLHSSLVICAMGDDDKNLKAALMMRQIFTAEKPDNDISSPLIHAIVYDDQKAENFSNQAQKMTNYKKVPFNIAVGGSMQSQYSFTNIRKLEELEREALAYHINWIFVRNETENGTYEEKSKWAGMSDEDKKNTLTELLNDYAHYEYFRQSSIAKAVHKKMLAESDKFSPDTSHEDHEHDPKDPKCRCVICRNRITEHMRWNVYMRVNGYRYGEKRNDMAKIHNALLPWTDLPFEERVKD